jgi:hypothetical protein
MAAWHFAVDYLAKSPDQTHVLVPALQPVALKSHTSTVRAFEKLDDDGKEAFLWRFRHAINNMETDFQLDGANGMLDCPNLSN